MEIKKLLSSSKNYTSSTRSASAIKYIVIHYTGNSTDKAVNNAKYFANNSVSASAHYFVDDNEIYQSVPDNHAAWSVGKNYGSNNMFGTVTNGNSISIELCSDGRVITGKTQENAVWLVKELMAKYDIPIKNVVRHYDVCSKLCPGWDGWYGKNAPKWEQFRDRFNTYYVVTASTLNMRDAAGTEGTKVIKKLSSGAKVKYLGSSKTIDGVKWRKVENGGVSGWVSGKYLKLYEQ